MGLLDQYSSIRTGSMLEIEAAWSDHQKMWRMSKFHLSRILPNDRDADIMDQWYLRIKYGEWLKIGDVIRYQNCNWRQKATNVGWSWICGIPLMLHPKIKTCCQWEASRQSYSWFMEGGSRVSSTTYGQEKDYYNRKSLEGQWLAGIQSRLQ